MQAPSEAPDGGTWFSWISGFCITCVIVFLGWYLLVAQPRARSMERANICARNMKDVVSAYQTYVTEHRGAPPQSLQTLLSAKGQARLKPRQLLCPETRKPYVLVPPTAKAWGGDVLLYEAAPSHGDRDGGNVAYMDGHVSWRSSEQIAEDLKTTRQRRAALAPAGAGH